MYFIEFLALPGLRVFNFDLSHWVVGGYFLINFICGMQIKGFKSYMIRQIVCMVYLLNWVMIQSYPSIYSYLNIILLLI